MSARDRLDRMTLRDKCAQMLVVPFRFDDPDYDALWPLVKKEGVGGICLFGGSLFDEAPFVNVMQRVAKLPLLVAANLEDGAGSQIKGASVFPSNLAIGATGSTEFARIKGRHTGIEARALGIRWAFAPVVDVDGGPRSFGDDPAEVVRLAREFLVGLRAAGVMACAKHFPGKPIAELAGEVDSIMTAHLKDPSIDPESPVSLSEAGSARLRGEMKFEGLIVTDDLTMDEVTSFCPPAEAIIRAVTAGADVLLFPADPMRALAILEAMVKAGRVPEASVDQAAMRILEAKDRLGLFKERITDQAGVEGVVGGEERRADAQRIADAAVTLVKGGGRLEERVALVNGEGYGTFRDELIRRRRLDDGSDVGVVALASDGEVEAVAAARSRFREVRVVSFGAPGLIRQFPDVEGYACAYGADEFSQRAAANALAGEIGFRGKLPVKLELKS